MNLPQRLRSLTGRGGILVWMLLAAYVLAPWAEALPLVTRTVVVPYCSAGSDSPDHPGPQRQIRLSFTAVQSSPGVPGFAAPPGRSAVALAPDGPLRIVALAPVAPAWPASSRRPLPRAPPGPTLPG